MTASPLDHIDHVIVLMLENRSFDNMLGWLYDAESPPDKQRFDGLRRSMWNPFSNIDDNGVEFTEKVSVRKNGESRKRQKGGAPVSIPVDYALPNPDPGEGFKDTNQQLFGHLTVPTLYPPPPLNHGFVDNYDAAMRFGAYSFHETPTDPRDILVAYDSPTQLPVLSTLAKSFGVCDHWYASVPSQTLPNRAFVHAATSDGVVNNSPTPNFHSPTIFNRIEELRRGGRDDLSWAVYSGTADGRPFSLTRLMMRALADAEFNDGFKHIADFYDDASSGQLPSYSFLEPQFSGPGQNDQHPNSDVRAGEQLIADVYNAVVSSPQWERTLLVITYDEHGGCYDHVAPPTATPPTWLSALPGDKPTAPDRQNGPAGQLDFTFNRLGVRVPTVLVSPWIKAGSVVNPDHFTPFDHTSVISTLRATFDLGAALTHRDQYAPDLACALNLEAPRTDRPTVTPLAMPDTARQADHVNDLHRFCRDLLISITGQHPDDDDDIIQWVADVYEAHFQGT